MNFEHANIEIEIHTFVGEEVVVSNPIGAEFDLADMYISDCNQQLFSSRYYHAWDEEHEAVFSNKLGVWLFSTANEVFFLVGYGRLDVINNNSRFNSLPYPEETLFFPLPDEYLENKAVKLKTTIVYTG